MQHSKHLLTGVILAGGQGRRMGGCDKGLLTVNGKPLVRYAADNLRPHVSTILVNANSGHEDYQKLGFAVVDDGEYAHRGPLAGILAGVRAATTPYIAISACDQLALPAEVYPQLLDAAQNNDNGLAVARDSERLHPTCAVVATGAAPSLESHLQQNQLRVGLWFQQQGATEVCFAGVDFHNINTPEDIQRAKPS
ncbi:molybdenum cofactor guanylyltransferase MobA [Porticoccus sp. W117]|uniref:molybdenum cofactor guanylyltransferase MobA n=1 Tax=Porticoccus sp. W117 TaxID=3054777 RepID=UPI00259524F3|nr:molybdenum cofactor guanylyltransferase MobA [Porticoccus sp. W117]MDM3871887.1 molybdenum cofactor guanylyltransferase MobA [Porticoccus sp. W117]